VVDRSLAANDATAVPAPYCNKPSAFMHFRTRTDGVKIGGYVF
jgi:hypothetical protein